MSWTDWGGRLSKKAPVPPTEREAEREQLLASLLTLAWVVEARDPYTGGHLWRVSRYAALLCETAGLPKDQTARIAMGGFLHDLGKVGVPDAILRKRGKLDDQEYAVIQTHPAVGARLLAGHPLAHLVLDAVLLHHEMPNGKGYPKRLTGRDIPTTARIVGLCDAFDAMTSTRPYRIGMPISQALSVIQSQLGLQFDAELGHQFLSLGQQGLLDHIAGHSDDGIPLQSCLMCGPTLVVRREQGVGDKVFCRECGGGYRLEAGREGAMPEAMATGTRGSAADLEPEPDARLIERFVRESAHLAFTSTQLPRDSGGAPRSHSPPV